MTNVFPLWTAARVRSNGDLDARALDTPWSTSKSSLRTPPRAGTVLAGQCPADGSGPGSSRLTSQQYRMCLATYLCDTDPRRQLPYMVMRLAKSRNFGPSAGRFFGLTKRLATVGLRDASCQGRPRRQLSVGPQTAARHSDRSSTTRCVTERSSETRSRSRSTPMPATSLASESGSGARGRRTRLSRE